MTTFPIVFDIGTTDPLAALGVTVRLDNTVVFDSNHIKEVTGIKIDCPDDESLHVLEIELHGKLLDHTKVNDNGEILSDALITINNMLIDGIDINKIFADKAKYTHNFNGTGSTVIEHCYGTLGCNGVVRLEFTTPFYLWLLENI